MKGDEPVMSLAETAHLYRIMSSVPLTIYDEWQGTNIIGQTGFQRPNALKKKYWHGKQRIGNWYLIQPQNGWINLDEAPPGAVIEILPPDNPGTIGFNIGYNLLKKHEKEAQEKAEGYNTHIGLRDVDENARLFFGDSEDSTDGVIDLSEYELPGDAESWHEAQYNDYGSGNAELWTAEQNSYSPFMLSSQFNQSLGQLPSSFASGKISPIQYDYTDVGTAPRPNRNPGTMGNIPTNDMNDRPRNVPQGGKGNVPGYDMNKSYRPNVPQGQPGKIPSHNLNTRTIALKPRPANEGRVYQPYFDQRFGSSQFIENINTPNLSRPDDYASFGQAIQTIKHNMNIFDLGDVKKTFTQFNRHRLPLPDQHLPRTIPYVFMTRPNISFMKSANRLEDQFYKDSLFNSVFEKNPEVVHNLDLSHNPNHQFNTILGSMSRSFEVSDEVIKTVDAGETYTGWKMVYGRNTNESNTASQIGIQYTDDAQLRIYYSHKLWLEYINKVYRGEFSPKMEMILDKIIDYSVALYYIVCAADGETILYWSKYYGIFPINTPGSKHSWTYGSPQVNQEFTVNYAYSLKVEMEPSILAEFNTHSKLPFKYRKIYDSRIGTSTPTFVNAPFTEKSFTPEGKAVYKLRFRN